MDGQGLQQLNLAGGAHEVVGNTFVINRATGSPSAILLSGGADKSIISGNTAYHSGAAAYGALVAIGSASNTRVVGNAIVTAAASLISGTDGSVPIEEGNTIIAR